MYYYRCDFISNLKLIVNMIDEMLLKVNFEKTKNFMRQILMNKSIYICQLFWFKSRKKIITDFFQCTKICKKGRIIWFKYKKIEKGF